MRALVLLATLWSQGMGGPPARPPAPLVVARAFAQPPVVQRPRRLQLEWSAPPLCPSYTELHARLSARLPKVEDPLEPGAVPLEARAKVAQTSEGFELHLALESAEIRSERTLSSSECSLLADAAVLMIAVTLDPVGLARTTSASSSTAEAPPEDSSQSQSQSQSPSPDPDPQPEPTPTSPSPSAADEPGIATLSAVAPASEPPRPTALRAGIRVFGGGGYGPTNTGYGAIGGSLALIGPRWRAAADARALPTRQLVLPTGAGGRFDAWIVGAVGCFVPRVRSFEFPVCLGLEGGQVRGRGVDTLPLVEQATVPYVALRLAPGLAWRPLERLALGFDLELAAPVTRGSFAVDAIEVQRIAPIGARGLLGLELRLP